MNNKSAWQMIEECKTQGDLTDQRLEWEYIQEFLRKNHFLYLDQKGKQVIKLSEGARIPWTNVQVSGTVNSPIAPHIITVSQGLEAKVVSNWPFLMPQVRAATSEEKDRDAAKNSSLLLQYYREANNEEELYRQGFGHMKSSGNYYIKDVWDKNLGDYGAMGPDGIPVRKGDISTKINAPQKMLIPSGIAHDEDLLWIGEQNALPIDVINEAWPGFEIKEEENLKDINMLRSLDYNGFYNIKPLKGHARVYEIYFKPNKEYPMGRLIIGCNGKILYDGVWDEKLTSKYPDEWHPYTHIAWITIEGDYWAKSVLFYIIEYQIALNRIFKNWMTSKKYPNGMWHYEEDAVDWKKVKQNSDDGTLRVPRKVGRQAAVYEPAPQNNVQAFREMQQIMKWMDDTVGNYEVSRGNNIPGVTSGKQVQMLQTANTIQASPLLGGIAKGWIGSHYRKVLRLCAVHYEDIGRLINVTGENNESIAFEFTPDQITSENIILMYGPLFYMDPQSRNQELDRMFAGGFFGNPQDPTAQKHYAKLRGIYGGIEEVYAELIADEQMAEINNKRLENGDWYEKDTVMISKHPDWIAYQNNLASWQRSLQAYELDAQRLLSGGIPEEEAAQREPPQEPGPEPQPPKIYIMARPYDDHAMAIRVLNRFRKSLKFERLCLENPELRIATDSLEASHQSFMNPPQMIPNQNQASFGLPPNDSSPPPNQ